VRLVAVVVSAAADADEQEEAAGGAGGDGGGGPVEAVVDDPSVPSVPGRTPDDRRPGAMAVHVSANLYIPNPEDAAPSKRPR
jgi:hypothetical protein